MNQHAIRDRLTLARRLGGKLGAIAVDAAVEPGGGALPLSPDALAQIDVFGRLLQRDGCGESTLPNRLVKLEATAFESPSSNCRNTIFETSWQDARGNAANGPGSLFVKQPCADLATRLFANVIGFWKTECEFCRNLAGLVPIATPRIHAVAQRRSRFVIVMENLLERPNTRLFVNRELLAGVNLAQAKQCLDTLARLHAHFSGMSAEDREGKLPLDLHPFLSPSLKPVMLAVNRLAVKPCRERAPEIFDADTAGLYRRALDHWEILAEAWYREPLTLVHGDSHLGNFFTTNDEMGMLDFQGAHWGKGIRDVQYFLINSMQPELLATHERELIADYCNERTRLGAPLDEEAGFEQYRGFSFQTLMTAVVSLGLGSFTDSDAVIQAMLRRSVAATQRLEFGSWLDARLAETRSPP